MRNLFLSICVCLTVGMSGCATAGSGSCGAPSLFRSSAVRNQPVRDCLRNWFRGDECSTCNPPAGMPTTCDSNMAPLCDAYGSGAGYSQGQPIYSPAPTGQPMMGQPIGQGVQLYSDPNLNIGVPTSAAPDYSSNLIDPVMNSGTDGFNLGIPTGSIDAGYGEIPMGPSF